MITVLLIHHLVLKKMTTPSLHRTQSDIALENHALHTQALD